MVLNSREILEAQIKSIPISPEFMYICVDSHNIYYDTCDGKRIAMRDNVVVLEHDHERLHLLFPKSNKIYVVKEDHTAWMFIGGVWVRISENPKTESAIKKILTRLFNLEKKYNNQIAIIPKRRGKFKLAAGQSYSITMDADIFIELPEIISRAEAPEIKLYIARNKGTIHFGTPYAIRSIHTENSIGMFDYHYYNDLIVTYKFLPTNRIWAYSIECISR